MTLRLARAFADVLREHDIDPDEVEAVELKTDSADRPQLVVKLRPQTQIINITVRKVVP